MMASLGNFKTLKISDARKNRRRTISEIDNFKNGLVSAVSIYYRLLFPHASAEERGENTPERQFVSTSYRTHNHQIASPTRSPLSHPGRARGR